MRIESKPLLEVLQRALNRHITACELERESAVNTGYTMDEVDDFATAEKDIHFAEMLLKQVNHDLQFKH